MDLESLGEEIKNCKLCDLYKTRNKLVLDDFRKKADIFVMGEAPGGHEDTISGEPFTGDAGENLKKFFEKIGLSREKIYIGNVVKCRPVKPSPRGRYLNYRNRRPTKKEINLCSKWILKEISLVKPKVLVSLGSVPLSLITGKNIPLKDVHGTEIYWQEVGLPVFVLYHPAAITYNPSLKAVYEKDLLGLKDFLYTKKVLP